MQSGRGLARTRPAIGYITIMLQLIPRRSTFALELINARRGESVELRHLVRSPLAPCGGLSADLADGWNSRPIGRVEGRLFLRDVSKLLYRVRYGNERYGDKYVEGWGGRRV